MRCPFLGEPHSAENVYICELREQMRHPRNSAALRPPLPCCGACCEIKPLPFRRGGTSPPPRGWDGVYSFAQRRRAPIAAALCCRVEFETRVVKHFELVRPWQSVVPFQAGEKIVHGEHHLCRVIRLGHRTNRHGFGRAGHLH